MYKVGFSTIGSPDYDVDQVIDLATSNGFQGVELRFLRGTIDLASLDEFGSSIAKTRKKFDDGGVEVVAVDTNVRMTSLDPVERAANWEMAQRYIGIAEQLGAPYIRAFAGPFVPEQDREATLEGIVEGLNRIAEYSETRGVTTLIESHDDFSESDALLELFDLGMSDAVGIMWDTLHTYRHGESAEQTWSKIGSRVKHVHVKDAYFANREGFDFALTGDGIVPVGSFLDVLRKAAYGGYVNFEWEKGWHPEIAGPEIAIPHFARFLSGANNR